MGKQQNRKSQKEFRQQLRKESPVYEKILWSKLQGRQLKGRKFRRQAGFGKYVVDFYCPSEKLIVELDGGYHKSKQRTAKDKIRDAYFKDRGVRVLRVPNPEGPKDLQLTLHLISSYFKD